MILVKPVSELKFDIEVELMLRSHFWLFVTANIALFFAFFLSSEMAGAAQKNYPRIAPPAAEDLKPIELNFLTISNELKKYRTRWKLLGTCVETPRKLTDSCKNKLVVFPGDELSIRAWGTVADVFLSQDRQYKSLSYGPNGTNEIVDKNLKIDGRYPYGALLCKTASEPVSGWRLCGAVSHGIINAGGQLQFLINDADQKNNLGSFYISISIGGHLYAAEKPPWAGRSDEEWYGLFGKLPHCFCDIRDIPKSQTTAYGKGRWSATFPFDFRSEWSQNIGQVDTFNYIKWSKGGHPGGVYDYRFHWTEINLAHWGDTDLRGGQQCIYDRNGKLINSGFGAGTPDIRSPVFTTDLPQSLLRLWLHSVMDEKPFKNLPIGVYLRRWPPNAGRLRSGQGGVCMRNVVPNGTDRLYSFRHLPDFN